MVVGVRSWTSECQVEVLEIYPENKSSVGLQEQELRLTPRFLAQTRRWTW